MGQSYSISTEVEIAAPPATVRSVFLDWERYHEFTNVWTITTRTESTKAHELKEGDTVKASIKGMTFKPKIVENKPELFSWCGSLPYIFTGTHSFHFRPSTQTPGGTVMTQEESFSGLLAQLIGPFPSLMNGTRKNWREFDQDIKDESEKLAAARS
ncbi:activator of hsp90 atpase 1 family protein [Colletotrichum sojae]|uniref:Activator of hsp90 atpase 1 family protein n=1 Tax=Colletotrichum sojae TaxID=2175907 RepID=A0A8H6IUI6_9PEZI|nr:activator of hsp90 atpase 1 family protein [Colletotrichum sojae]